MIPELVYDDWQKKVLKTKGNLCICSGRQVGKSTIISKDAGDYALKNPNKVIMIIASVERQALLLFEKVLSHIFLENKREIQGKPLKHQLELKNGTKIYCLPTGDSGYGIRGFTIDRLYADEAAFINEDVWAAVSPMLATTGGNIILLSTPFGSDGYFHRCFHDKKFTSIHVNTEEVAEKRKEPQRTQMLEFLKDEKGRMTKLQYQQEYLGLFVGGIQKYFPDDLIEMICTLKKDNYKPLGDKYQGIDIARLGGDDTVLTSLDRIGKKKLRQFDLEITERQRLTDTTRLIIHKDKLINHKKIYIDDGGLGVGVFDSLLEDQQTKRKIIAINNSSRLIDKERGQDKNRKKPLMKEALYANLKNLMENNCIQLFDNPEIKQSLKSIQADYSDGVLKIYGNYSHIVEALIRAAWCIKDKSLNIYIC